MNSQIWRSDAAEVDAVAAAAAVAVGVVEGAAAAEDQAAVVMEAVRPRGEEQGEKLQALPHTIYRPLTSCLSSSSSNTGGTSRGGSGVKPTYGGGAYYGGGSTTPYAAGRRSPLGLAPFLLPATALAFFPGLWLYGAYAYPYSHPYHYTNQTDNKNESIPVVCLCEKHAECGCDDNDKDSYYQSLFNGTEPKNGSNVRVAEVNGTEKIFINGTLPNGTTADESSSSDNPKGPTAVSTAPGPVVALLHASGYWVMVVLVISSVYML